MYLRPPCTILEDRLDVPSKAPRFDQAHRQPTHRSIPGNARARNTAANNQDVKDLPFQRRKSRPAVTQVKVGLRHQKSSFYCNSCNNYSSALGGNTFASECVLVASYIAMGRRALHAVFQLALAGLRRTRL
jgi:hypothetical protein